MNQLQTFLAECNRQARAINQEAAIVNGSKVHLTFGDPQLNADMQYAGTQFQIITPAIGAANQFASPPRAGGKVTRCVNNVEYFIADVDPKDPVTYTFVLVDRDPQSAAR